MTTYTLAKGVTLKEDSDASGGILRLDYPLRMLRLSKIGMQAAAQLCGKMYRDKKEDAKLMAFASYLESQGFLNRSFSNLPEEELPMVTITIPTHNRHSMLSACIGSLLELDYPQEKMEVIVVDDASTEPVEVDHSLVRVLRLPGNSGPSAARNRALREAKGEIIAFLDDDCLASKGWLRALVSCFQYADIVAVGGRVEAASLQLPVERYEQVQSSLFMGANQQMVGSNRRLSYLPSCNLLVRKRSLLAVGGFNEFMRVGEDVDLCWRLLAIGNIYYLPEGVVYHHHRAQILLFLKRRFEYGMSEAKLNTEYPSKKRQLAFFPGNIFILTLTAMLVLKAGLLTGFVTGAGLVLLNLPYESLLKWFSIEPSCYKPGFWQILQTMARSQAAAFYLFSQHFTRYYSAPCILTASFFLPPLAPFFAAIHLLHGLVNYKLKKPALGAGHFVFYNFCEDIFYQSGVFYGCMCENNWRPLDMNFTRLVPAYWKE